MARTVAIGLLVVVVALGFVIVRVLQPQDLSDLGGRGVETTGDAPRDLKQVLEQSIERRFAVTLTENEINRWLAQNVKMEQHGLLSGCVSDSRVWVRLGDGVAEVILERKVLGRPLTFSMYFQLQIEEKDSVPRKEILLHGGPLVAWWPTIQRGGRFGRLNVPQGYLHLLLPAYRRLADACRDELHLAFEEMSDIRIEKNRLVLDPLSRGAKDSSIELR